LDRARVEQWLQETGHVDQKADVILDETRVVKQGSLSVGVTRQYLGCVGKVANGQVVVTLHGAWGNDDVPLTGELYLPEAWAKDAERRAAAKVPRPSPLRWPAGAAGPARPDRRPLGGPRAAKNCGSS